MVDQRITQTNVNETRLPDWYVQYLTPILQSAVQQSGAAYQPYTGPLVASMTPDQLEAYRLLRENQGNQYEEYINPAVDLARQSGAVDSGAAAAGEYGQARDIFGRLSGAETASISEPYVSSGSNYLRQAAEGSSLYAANPYIAASVAPTGIAAASPYLSAAVNQTGLGAASPYLGMAATSFPEMADEYMSPYTGAVLDQIAKRGGRNLSENLLPQISDQFVRAGQFGSAQQRDVVGRALRDTQEAILAEQAKALESGYGTAGQLYGADAARYAGLSGTAGGLGSQQQQALLTAAGTAGGLGTQQQQILQGAGSTLGNLSASDLSRLAAAGVNIGNLGIAQAGIAGSDLSRQLQAAQGLQGIGQSMIQARQSDADRGISAAGQLGNLANIGVDTGLRTTAALESAGAAQQAQNQANINAAYGQFQQQQQYPWEQIGRASNVIQGLPVNTSSSSTSQTTQPGPSTLSQLGGIGLGIAGLANSGIFKARGGAVKKKTSHSYGRTPRRGISLAMAA